jgi:hypothetical protein
MRLRQISANQWAGLAVVGLTGLLYLTTLQTDINGAETPYTPDVGEIVNALNLRGILHQAGYPIFSMFGSGFVTVARLFGVNPAAAAGLWSWLWAVAAVGLAYLIVLHLTGRRWVAAVTALTLAVSRSLWVNGSIAELQSFSLSLAAVILLMALRTAESGAEDPRWFHGLAFVFGLAVSHGRALVLLAPALAALLWRPYFTYVHRKPLALFLHIVLAFLPWLSYLYLPLRAYMGAEWTFSEPTDWESLRPYITADETRTNITIATTPAEWVERTRLHLEVLNTELLPGLLIVGLMVALVVPLLDRRYSQAAFFTTAWIPFFTTAYFAYVGHVWDAYLAVLMPVTLIGVLGLGMEVNWLAERRVVWGRVAIGIMAVAAVAAATLNYGYVSQLKAAARGRSIIESFKPALDFSGPGRTVLSATWGLDYFALAYGALVTHELPGVVAIDQSAPYAELIAAGDRVYVLPQFFYVFGLDFWDNKLGRAYLTSAAPGIIRVAASPPLTLADVPDPDPRLIGDSISLLSHQMQFEPQTSTLHVTLYWQAEAPPSQDYSVFVHLSDQPAILTGEDILAQSDSAAPVYGFYPTTRWSTGEIVREDYTIPLPDSRKPTLLRVGLYTRTSDGGFNNLGEANFAIEIP